MHADDFVGPFRFRRDLRDRDRRRIRCQYHTGTRNCIQRFKDFRLRFEVFNDQGGANRLGNGVNETMKEVTATHKFQLAKNMFTRLEYRHDWSNQGVFSLHNPGQTGSNQNTISADYYVTF